MYFREKNIFLSELVDVVVASQGGENHKIMKKHFAERAFGKPKVKALDLKDEKTAHILASAFWASSPIGRHH